MTQADLRHRMERLTDQIREQHHRMSPMFIHLKSLLVEGQLRNAQTTAFRLQGALHAHFLLEQEIVFPFLAALCPDRSSEISLLTDDHQALGSRFAELVEQILANQLDAADQSVTSFGDALTAHESREEELLKFASEIPA